jgi:hypothetical protein
MVRAPGRGDDSAMPIRVFLVLPPIPRAAVTRLLDSAGDIVVLGSVNDLSGLDRALATAQRADVVLVSGDGGGAADAFALLGLQHVPAIVSIDSESTNVEVHEVIPTARALGDLSTTDFVEEIRAVTSRQVAR